MEAYSEEWLKAFLQRVATTLEMLVQSGMAPTTEDRMKLAQRAEKIWHEKN